MFIFCFGFFQNFFFRGCTLRICLCVTAIRKNDVFNSNPLCDTSQRANTLRNTKTTKPCNASSMWTKKTKENSNKMTQKANNICKSGERSHEKRSQCESLDQAGWYFEADGEPSQAQTERKDSQVSLELYSCELRAYRQPQFFSRQARRKPRPI